MYYYARPFSYNPEEARRLYWEEVKEIQEATGEMVISTIPLTQIDNIEFDEDKIFELAEVMIKKCKGLIFKSSSYGVDKEIEMAKRNKIPYGNYWVILNKIKGVGNNG